jgi:hypothetical protein
VIDPLTALYLAFSFLLTATFFAAFSDGDDVDSSWQKRAIISLLAGFLFPIWIVLVGALAIVFKLLELRERITEGPSR